MKKFNLLYILIIILIILSCKDILDETVRSDVSFAYYDTEEGIESGVGAAYERLRAHYESSGHYVFFQTVGTDTYMAGRNGTAQQLDAYAARIEPSFTSIYDLLWVPYYDGINRTNTVLDALEKIGDKMPEDLKMTRRAELRFLRGYYYFFLVQNFGRIPLVTIPELGVRTDFPSSSVAEVYDQIIADLTFAVENLPLTQPDYGRATKGAAEHALAKVYLTRGSAVTDQRGQQSTDMENAAHYADEVIFSGQYELVADFADLWDINNQRNSEIIFAVQFSKTDLYNNNNGNKMHLIFGTTYDIKPGMQRSIEYGRPFADHRPTSFTIRELFNPLFDSRFHKTFRSVWYCNNPGNIPVWEAVDGFEPAPELLGKPKFTLGDTAVWITNEVYPANTNFDSLYASRPYYYMPVNRQNISDYFALIKHLDPQRSSINEVNGSRDGFLFRLGETYLIAAEAYGRIGNFSTAADRLNEVRRRAAYKEGEPKPTPYWKVYGGNYADREKSTEQEMLVTAQDLQNEPSFVDFILDERAKELVGELMRWRDLVRTEKLVERARKYNPIAAPNIQEYHSLRPIPQNHLDRLDPQPPIEEVQNEGYY